MARQDEPFTRVQSLVNTSVDDMHSSLNFYQSNIQSDVETIRYALQIVARRKEKTKATMLRRKLKKMEKEQLHELYLSRLADVDDASV